MKLSENHTKFWEFVVESLAWAIIAVVAMLLMQARQVDRWYLEGESAILIVPLLCGAAIVYLRNILWGQSKPLQKVVEAESFILKRAGIVLAKLEEAENSFGPTLALYDLGGTLRAKLAVDSDLSKRHSSCAMCRESNESG